MGKFVISQAKNGVKFNLKAANGEVIASSQVYKDEKYCRKGIASVINNAPVAPIEDQTAEGFTPCKHPKFEVLILLFHQVNSILYQYDLQHNHLPQ